MNLRTICEIEGNPCRDIVEGRVKVTPPRTVAAKPFEAPRAVKAMEDENPVKSQGDHGAGTEHRNGESNGVKLSVAFDLFLATKPGRFTSRQLLNRLPEFDWVPTDASRTTVAQLCRQLVIAGVLDVVEGRGSSNDPYVYAVRPVETI